MRYTHSKAEDARSDRVTSVGYANQGPGRACTKSALSILYRCKKCGRMPKDDFTFFCGKRPLLKSQKAGARCCCAYCRAAK